MGKNRMTFADINLEHCVRQRLNNYAFKLDYIFLSQLAYLLLFPRSRP